LSERLFQAIEGIRRAKQAVKAPNSSKLSSFLAQLNNNSFICNPIEEKIQDLKKKYHVENL
jgi:hypothetical protein